MTKQLIMNPIDDELAEKTCQQKKLSWLQCLSVTINPHTEPRPVVESLDDDMVESTVGADTTTVTEAWARKCGDRQLFTFQTLGFLHNQVALFRPCFVRGAPTLIMCCCK